MTIEFQGFPKITRLSRTCTVTEKIDGSNAAVGVRYIERTGLTHTCETLVDLPNDVVVGVWAQSRKRIITTTEDNFGFARWVNEHAKELAIGLGHGLHFGEWWGSGIQRGYGLAKGEKRFSLFNTARWADENGNPHLSLPACCGVVPTLYHGIFTTEAVDFSLFELMANGSKAAPGFMDAEGVVIWHEAARQLFKKTLKNDQAPKSLV